MTAPAGDTITTPRRGLLRRIGYLAKRAVQVEIAGYLSIYRFVFRRPRVPADATAFTYHQPVAVMFAVFIVGSVVEIVVIDLIARRWPGVRIALLVVGVWGLVWMLGMLFGYLTRPHAVGPAGIRVRHGAEIDITLAWDDIDEIAIRSHAVEVMMPPLFTVRDDGGTVLHLPIQERTAVDIVLATPVQVRLPQRTTTLAEIRLAVDDPRGFLEAARPHI